MRQIEGAPEGESREGELRFTQLRLGDTYDVGPMTIQPFRALHPRGAFVFASRARRRGSCAASSHLYG